MYKDFFKKSETLVSLVRFLKKIDLNEILNKVQNKVQGNRIFKQLSIFFDKIIWRLKRPALPNVNGIYVHLGCGDINDNRMINIDVRPRNHVHYLHTVNTLPMFQDNSVDLIYISHCLEHISFINVPAVLKEWNRVLKKGGLLKVSVPDFKTILEIYHDTNDISEINPPLMGGQDYPSNFHYVAFDEKYLTKLFSQAGFENIKVWSKETDDFSKFDDWSNRLMTVKGKSYKISLNLQAIKI